jgi:hypothetical protein
LGSINNKKALRVSSHLEMNEQTMRFFAKYYKKGAPKIGKSHLLVSMLHHILGRLGRDLGALSAYYGYVRNLFFWFECQTHRYE